MVATFNLYPKELVAIETPYNCLYSQHRPGTYLMWDSAQASKYNINQQQPSLGPKILQTTMDTQQTSQDRPPVFLSVILFYLKSYSLLLP